jgi:hypothetical protein
MHAYGQGAEYLLASWTVKSSPARAADHHDAFTSVAFNPSTAAGATPKS